MIIDLSCIGTEVQIPLGAWNFSSNPSRQSQDEGENRADFGCVCPSLKMTKSQGGFFL